MFYNYTHTGRARPWCAKTADCTVLGLAFCKPLGYHVAMNNESLENIARKLADAVPDGLRAVRADLEDNFRAVLRSSLNKLDLVTREEFDVQEAVLARTRAKLEALEARVTEMESRDNT